MHTIHTIHTIHTLPPIPTIHPIGTKFRKMLRAGEDIPTWFAFESVVKVLREEAQAAAA